MAGEDDGTSPSSFPRSAIRRSGAPETFWSRMVNPMAANSPARRLLTRFNPSWPVWARFLFLQGFSTAIAFLFHVHIGSVSVFHCLPLAKIPPYNSVTTNPASRTDVMVTVTKPATSILGEGSAAKAARSSSFLPMAADTS